MKSFKCICYEFQDGLKAFRLYVSDFVSCGKLGITRALEQFLRLKTYCQVYVENIWLVKFCR